MAHHFQTASAITINGTPNGELTGLRNGCESSSTNSSSTGGPKVLSKAAAAKLSKGSSLATLCNIGNSCYMNSVLYTLRLAPNFTHNLHHLIEFCNLALPRRSLEQSVFSLDSLTSHATPAQQQQQPAAQHKPKSSSLGRNIPGLHVANGRSWSSKDLASLGASNASGSANIGSAGSSTIALAASGSNSSGEASNHTNGGNDLYLGSPSTNAVSVGLISNNNEGDGGCGQQQHQHAIGGAANAKSSSQVVCETLHDLFHSLTHNEATGLIEPFHAGSVLQAVQSVSTTFEGNQQQDAHEFLMCILDSVREACQTLNRNLLANPELLRNSSTFAAGASSTALVDGLDSNSQIAPVSQPVSESKFSNTPFNPRYIFRRRKESVKSAKAAGCKLKGVRAPSLSLTKVVSSTVPTQADSTPAGTVSDSCALLDATGEAPASAGPKASGVSLDERTQAQDRILELGLNFFREDFEGVTVSRTRCLSCETVTEQKETMIDIAIPIAASEINDVAKNAQQFYQDACITEEYFRGDNKYRCETCSGYTEACRSISFEILPRLLIVQLKRFNGDMEKINSYIPTPFVLQCFCRDCLGKPEADKRHIYRLYSVITHVGARLSVGHYIAYTCSLELPQQYFNCARERQRRCLLAPSLDGSGHGPTDGTQQQQQLGSTGGAVGGGKGLERSSEKSTSGQLKKLFGGKKLSSAGDMSKKLKYNVISRFSPTNGVDTSQLNGSNNSVATVSAAGAGQVCTDAADGRIGAANDGSPVAGVLAENGAGRSPQESGNSFAALHCPSSSCCGVSVKGTSRPLATTGSVLGPGTTPVIPAASLLLDGSSGASNNGSSSSNASRTNGGRAIAPIATIHPNAHLVINHNHVIPESINGDNDVSALPNGLLPSSFALNPHATHSGSIAHATSNNHCSSANNGNNTSVGSGLDYATQQQYQQLQMKWFMCDDDKIKVMTQAEFEDMLSPRRRHVITPYLLFYARFDVQSAATSPQLVTSQPNVSSGATNKTYVSQASSTSASSSGIMLASATSTNHPVSSGSPPTVLPDAPNSSVVTQ
uniref:Putative ubiquitin specific protease n=2 Tax=Anopheles triannulatus TaxID=58253 RepID=A0A2M4AH52_9DIPT